MKPNRLVCLLIIALLASASPPLRAQSEDSKADAMDVARQKAINYLKTAQARDGSWTTPMSPAISGLVTYALLESGVKPDTPEIAKALQHLQTFVQPDGGIYSPKSQHANYETSILVLVFRATNQGEKYDSVIKNADTFLRNLQWDDTQQTEKADPRFGGAGYGGPNSRPDLSNTTFFLEALEAAGAKPDDPAVQNALVFLSRCQNLESEHNTLPAASKVNDGGFIYTPAAGGSSPAGTTENGGLRSYGSMTYAGLKSMVYAGLTPEDKRVKAALEWIKKHYTVEENPGLGQQGKFYYFHVFAKTLATLKLDRLQDDQGVQHDWRNELASHLIDIQQENGAWLNKSDRWFEGNPDLATAFALLSLSYCEPISTLSK
ncbi:MULTISPECIES: prenyltransferase/squalene oxidase repeat-containing protein [unclassified Schlesneria]|uniref:prenyltransferase/squalene oxidase repeat-containing protein n=1 Tax=Schlesneria TaxID=656899 RepID=UPI002EF32B6F